MASGFSQIGSGSPLDQAWLVWLATPQAQPIPKSRTTRTVFDAGWHARNAEVEALKRQLQAERASRGLQ